MRAERARMHHPYTKEEPVEDKGVHSIERDSSPEVDSWVEQSNTDADESGKKLAMGGFAFHKVVGGREVPAEQQYTQNEP